MTASLLLVTLLVGFFPQENPRQVQELVEQLSSGTPVQRESAASKLKELGSIALPELEKASRSTDVELAQRAGVLLRVIPIRMKLSANLLAQVSRIDERLASMDPHAWTEVFREIADQVTVEQDPPGLEGINTRIVRMYKDLPDAGLELPLKGEDVRVLVAPAVLGCRDDAERVKVFEAIRSRNLRSATSNLLTLLKDPSIFVRCRTLEALAQLRAASATPEVRKCLADPEREIRLSATRALMILGGAEVCKELMAMLKDSSADVRGVAVFSLSGRECAEAGPAIAVLLSDSDSKVREISALVLGRLVSKEILPALMLALGDPEENVRTNAAHALGQFKDPSAAGSLAKLMSDRSVSVRTACVKALGQIEHPDRVVRLVQALEDPVQEVRMIALQRLMELKEKSTLESIARLQSSPSAHERLECFRALAKIGGKAALPQLEKGLEDGEWFVQQHVLLEIWLLGGREALPAVRKLYKTTDHQEPREFAAFCLGEWGARDGVATILAAPHLIECLNGIRKPGLYQQLRDTKRLGGRKGTFRELIQRVAEPAGLKVEWPDEQGAWLAEEMTVPEGEDNLGVLYTLIRAKEFSFVLEDQRLIIMPREKAMAFWKAWWAAEEKK